MNDNTTELVATTVVDLPWGPIPEGVEFVQDAQDIGPEAVAQEAAAEATA